MSSSSSREKEIFPFGYNNNSKCFVIEDRGFTLIELLASILILAATVSPILCVFSYGLRVSASSGRQTQAVYYAQELMEKVRSNSSNLVVGCYDADELYILGLSTSPPEGMIPSVNIIWENQNWGLYRVIVNIQWGLSPVKNVRLITLLAS